MLIRMSDRVRFCDREVVTAGALQSITVDLRWLKTTRDRSRAFGPGSLTGTSFGGRDPRCAVVCALTIKSSSYAQPRKSAEISFVEGGHGPRAGQWLAASIRQANFYFK